MQDPKNPRCPLCKSTKVIKRGKRETKFGHKQIFYCKKCYKRFVEDKIKSKIYPPRFIIAGLSYYNQGYNLDESVKFVNRKYKTKLSTSTLNRWLLEYSGIISFKDLRKNALKYFEKGDFISSKLFKHRGLKYEFRYHKPKLKLLGYSYPGFSKFFKYLQENGCPEQVFENGERCSQLNLDVKIKKTGWKNQACKMANLAIQGVSDNSKRHDEVESFMLINDKATIACEIPIWLWEKKLNIGVSGHIDILQIRLGRVYILDFKPNAEKEYEKKVMSQLYLYAKGLAFRTRVPLKYFRCAWFDEKNYFEFDPSQIKIKEK